MKIQTNKKCVMCGATHYAKTLCKLHYDRQRYQRDIDMEVRKKGNEYLFNGEYVEVTYYNKQHKKAGTFLVDADMVEKIKNIKWSQISTGYIAGYRNKKTILLHRFITNCPDGLVVDHLNHNRLDNRLSNLKICTQKENMENCEYPTGATGIRGITKTKSDYFIAQKDGKYLGCSKDMEIAKSFLEQG